MGKSQESDERREVNMYMKLLFHLSVFSNHVLAIFMRQN